MTIRTLSFRFASRFASRFACAARPHALSGLPVLALAVAVAACDSTLELGDADAPSGPADAPTTGSPDGPTSGGTGPVDWSGAWEWLAPQTTTRDLRGAWAAGPDDLWLVGARGTVLRWDGKTRARLVHQGALDATFRAVAGRSANDVWVVGDHAAVHFDGKAWTESVYASAYDLRSVVVTTGAGAGVYGLSTDGAVVDVQHGGVVTRDALDLVPAKTGGFYVLRKDGVDLLGTNAPVARVASFDQKTLASSVTDGALIGDAPDRFRFLFGYDSGSLVTYRYWTGTAVEQVAAWTASVERAKVTDPEKRVVLRTGADRVFVRLGDYAPSMFDGVRWRTLPAMPVVGGAFVLPTGDLGLVGDGGYVARATAQPYDEATAIVTALSEAGDRRSTAISVSPDGTAWAVSATLRGERYRTEQFGRWDEVVGWQWYATPAGFEARGIAAVSSTNVWLLLRQSTDGLLYGGGTRLARWNGTSLDVVRDAPKPLRTLSTDRAGGFYALALDGTLYRAGGDGALTTLADAGTAGEHDLALCDPELAPLDHGAGVFVLDQECALTFWDGASLRTLPSVRLPEHGSGHQSLALSATSATSLWVSDSSKGLRHFDGAAWTVVYPSQLGARGVWAVDDRHVWFVDAPYTRGGDVLRMFDGASTKAVTSVSAGALFGGGGNAVWLTGEGTLRLRGVTRGTTTR